MTRGGICGLLWLMAKYEMFQKGDLSRICKAQKWYFYSVMILQERMKEESEFPIRGSLPMIII